MRAHSFRFGRALASALALTGLVCAGIVAPAVPRAAAAGVVAPPPTDQTTRLAGVDRYATAVAVSRNAYPSGSRTALVALGTDFPDALSAVPLAARLEAPLLLTGTRSLPASTRAELQRLRPDRIIIVGGTGAVERAVETQLRSLAGNVARLSGADRFATAEAIARYGWGADGSAAAFVATGAGFADALAAGAAAAKLGSPVVLVPGGNPSAGAATAKLLRDLGTSEVRIAGGTGVVSVGMARSLAAGGRTVVRYGGSDRFATTAAIVTGVFGTGSPFSYWANGFGFADALSAGAAAGARGVPLILTRSDCVPDAVQGAAAPAGSAPRLLVGGTAVLADAVGAGARCFASAPTPRISGRVAEGQRVTAVPGAWQPAPTTLAYQWRRNGAPIAGGTGQNYVPVRADRGTRLSVSVTATRSGYARATRSSETAVVAEPPALRDPRSISVVVNKRRPLSPVSYEPSDLRTPSGIPNANGQPVRSAVATALEQMNAAAKNAGVHLVIRSGYRSYQYQVGLYNANVANSGRAAADVSTARPGYSEHQTGLVADIDDGGSCVLNACFGGTAAGQWLRANAYKYGFILRYDQGQQHITGYEYEPWHFRYVGTAIAGDMRAKGIRTLEQYFGLPAAPSY
ncbi:cell wall-binding repeat-containing protein [Leucobacter iarius]|uniref:D-alanyl-D-alanine carboxypeptidase-like core domain-containing protein n=1 Tax=Leucobacter iarius TaxID=333963 RepID=A0ABP4XJ34_9MICO